MSLKRCGGALVLLLGLWGCDKLRAFPGFASAQAAVAPAAPPVLLGPWLLEPVPGQVTVAWVTCAPSPSAEGPIRVLVYGNNRTNHGDHALVVRAATAEGPHLLLHTGDMV